MAVCKICGAVKKNLPDDWINWECSQCEGDQNRTYHNYQWPVSQKDKDFAATLEDGFHLVDDEGDNYKGWPSREPTPDEIIQAKEDGVCPRCDTILDIDKSEFYCPKCGWSF